MNHRRLAPRIAVLALLLPLIAPPCGAAASGAWWLDAHEALDRLDALADAHAVAVDPTGTLAAAAFPDGRKARDSRVRIVDARGDGTTDVAMPGEVRALLFLEDGSLLAIAARRTKRRPAETWVLEVAPGEDRARRRVPVPHDALGLTRSPDGSRLLIACEDEIRTFVLPGWTSGPLYRLPGTNRALASLGGSRYLVASDDRVVVVDLDDPPGDDGIPVRASVPAGGPVLDVAVVDRAPRIAARLGPDGAPIRLPLPAASGAAPGERPRTDRPIVAEVRSPPGEPDQDPVRSSRPPERPAPDAPPSTDPVDGSTVRSGSEVPSPESGGAAPEPGRRAPAGTDEPPWETRPTDVPPAESTDRTPPPVPQDRGSAPASPEAGDPDAPVPRPAPEPAAPSGTTDAAPTVDDGRAVASPPGDAGAGAAAARTACRVSGTVTGERRGAVRWIVVYGPDNVLREAARVAVDAEGRYCIEDLEHGTYRIVPDGGGDRVVECDPAFRVLRVESDDPLPAQPFAVVRVR